MSQKIILIPCEKAVWAERLPQRAKYLFCYLLSFVNDQHYAKWPGYDRLTKETGLCIDQVDEYLSMLQDRYLLSVENLTVN